MTPSSIPENILRRMSVKDRKELGVQTAEEAQATFIARNERELQNQISQFLRMKGIWFYNARMDRATTAAKGVPDYLLAWGYQPVAMEVKFGNGKLSTEQMATHNAMLKNGWRVYIVRSVEDVKIILDSLEREHEKSIKF